jgi:plasmid maintenance system killer protein
VLGNREDLQAATQQEIWQYPTGSVSEAHLAGNSLEALSGNRKALHSIRINEQFRLCFLWKNGKAYNVEIVDYH